MLYVYKWMVQQQSDLIVAWGVDKDGGSRCIELPYESFILLEKGDSARELPGIRCLEANRIYIDEYNGGKTYSDLLLLPTGSEINRVALNEIGNAPQRFNYKKSFLNHVDPLHRYFILKQIPYYCGWFDPTTCTAIPEEKDIPPFTLLFYDLECVPLVENRFPHELNPSDYVGSISFVKCRIHHDEPTIIESTVLMVSNRSDSFTMPDYTVIKFPTEKSLLKHAITLFKDPTVQFICGFNNNQFDDKYLFARYFYHGLEKEIWKGVYPFKDDSPIALWYHPRQLSLDVYKFYKVFRRHSSYSLDALAKEILQGETKKPMDYKLLRHLFLTIDTCPLKQVKQIVEYNYYDSYITMQLFCKAKIIDFACTISAMCYLNLERVILAGKSELLTGYLVIEAYRNGYLMNISPTRNHDDGDSSSYQGAVVFLERPGLYDSVSCLDFLSLYPSIINSKNLSPSTCRLSDDEPKTPEDMQNYFSVRVSENLFCWSLKKFVRVGVFPFLCQKLLDARQEIKVMLLSDKLSENMRRYLSFLQLALKIANNSTYGLLGSPHSQFHCKMVAETVTAHARKTILAAKDYFESIQVRCVFLDTDSLFILSGSEARGRALAQDVNRHIGDQHLVMEYEYFFTKIFLFSKKKYCGIIEGSFKASGFELKKKDFPAHCKVILEQLLHLVLKDDPIVLVARSHDFARQLFRWDIVHRYELFSKHITLKPMYKYSSNCSAPHVKFIKRLGERNVILQGQFVPLLYSPLASHQKDGFALGLVDQNNRLTGIHQRIPVHLVQAVKSACTLFDKIFKVVCPQQDDHYFQDCLKTIEKYNLVIFELKCMFNTVIVTFSTQFSITHPQRIEKRRPRQTTITDYLQRIKKIKYSPAPLPASVID